MTETYYDVLGVSEEASTDEIEAAYRERLKETHPDVSDADDARRTTQAIVEARDVLVDEAERARYDDIGHDAYVGTGEPTVGSESNAAAAARRAGYGQASSEAGDTETRNDQSSDQQRRADRERRARERVSGERTQTSQNRQRSRSQGTNRTTASTASTTSAGTTTQGMSQGGSTATQYSVRQEYDVVEQPEDLLPSGRALTVFGLAFAFYPVLLASAVFPPFPLTVNIFVGLCAVFVFGYLQSMPRIAVMVFGGWSVIAPLILLGLPFGIFSIVGIFTLCGTWLPFGFSVLTLSILRSGAP